MSYRPGWVSTPMTFHEKDEMFTLNPNEAVNGALKQLSYEESTNGHWKHSLESWIAHLFPLSLVMKIITSKSLERYRKLYAPKLENCEKIENNDEKLISLLVKEE